MTGWLDSVGPNLRTGERQGLTTEDIMTLARVSILALVGLAVSANPQCMPDGRSATGNERAAAPLDRDCMGMR